MSAEYFKYEVIMNSNLLHEIDRLNHDLELTVKKCEAQAAESKLTLSNIVKSQLENHENMLLTSKNVYTRRKGKQ
jgi:hypothetical protein